MRLFRSSVVRAALLGVSFALVTPAVPLVQPALARSAPDSFADLAAKLLPAVVNVSSTQTITAKNGAPGPGAGPEMPIFPPGSPFEQFFKDFLNRNQAARAAVAAAIARRRRGGRRASGPGSSSIPRATWSPTTMSSKAPTRSPSRCRTIPC